MLAITGHRLGHGFPLTGPKSDLSRAIKIARDKQAEGLPVGSIISYLTAYGFAFYTATAAVREVMPS